MKKIYNAIYNITFWLVVLSGLMIGYNGLTGSNILQNMYPLYYKNIYIIVGISAIILILLECKRKREKFVIVPPNGFPYVGGWNDKWALWFFR